MTTNTPSTSSDALTSDALTSEPPTTIESGPVVPTRRGNDWQQQNLAAIHERLQPLRKMQDGLIYTIPSGIHFHVIIKDGSAIRFLLVEQSDPNTGVVQSEIDIDQPMLLMEPYTQAMLLTLLWKPQPARVYMAGLGGGRLPLLLHHYLPKTIIDCTDIDPAIVEVAKAFFALPSDERMNIAIEDGRKWLEDNETIYDIILVDVFLDKGYTPYRMTTLEFFQLCRNRLTADGVIAINILSEDPFVPAKVHTLHQFFPYVYTFAEPSGNTILIGSGVELPINLLRTRAAQLDAIHAFPFLFREIGDQLIEGAGELAQQQGNAEILRDAQPPATYFDSLPSFNSPFSRVAPELPCPCGSGLHFADCHGSVDPTPTD